MITTREQGPGLPAQFRLKDEACVEIRRLAIPDYDAVVRMDGDGQHSAEDVGRLLGPVVNGTADVVLGSRFTGTERRAGRRPPS